MGENFTPNLDDIKGFINNPDFQEKLKTIMEYLPQNKDKDSENNNTSFEMDDSFLMMQKVKKMLDKKKDVDDPRINLLNAIKPYLKHSRQQQIDNYTKILNVTMFSQILKDE